MSRKSLYFTLAVLAFCLVMPTFLVRILAALMALTIVGSIAALTVLMKKDSPILSWRDAFLFVVQDVFREYRTLYGHVKTWLATRLR